MNNAKNETYLYRNFAYKGKQYIGRMCINKNGNVLLEIYSKEVLEEIFDEEIREYAYCLFEDLGLI